MSRVDYLFVYGTLTPSLAPAVIKPIVMKLRPIGPGSVAGRLYDLGPYPAAIFDAAASTRIFGEVFVFPEADPEAMRRIDEYEGFDPGDLSRSLYVRTRQCVTVADGSDLNCWAYQYNRDVTHARLLANGNYAKRM
ncbi:MAG TPA: gamma-glutamylcyclotransferase family protein [Pirellulales bacterium]|nr:gamma-glutamylcyclotransferase family protein [Pirellulales bacterium]